MPPEAQARISLMLVALWAAAVLLCACRRSGQLAVAVVAAAVAVVAAAVVAAAAVAVAAASRALAALCQQGEAVAAVAVLVAAPVCHGVFGACPMATRAWPGPGQRRAAAERRVTKRLWCPSQVRGWARTWPMKAARVGRGKTSQAAGSPGSPHKCVRPQASTCTPMYPLPRHARSPGG